MVQPAAFLATPSLLGERPAEEHLSGICALFADPAVSQWIQLDPFSTERTHEVMEIWREHWAQHGWGMWVWRERTTGRVVGRGGLRHIPFEGQSIVELIYALRPEFWSRGYGTELSRAVVENAFTALALPEIIAMTVPTNRGSQRVMEKSGFTFEREIVHANLPHVLYRQRREDFLARRQQAQ